MVLRNHPCNHLAVNTLMNYSTSFAFEKWCCEFFVIFPCHDSTVCFVSSSVDLEVVLSPCDERTFGENKQPKRWLRREMKSAAAEVCCQRFPRVWFYCLIELHFEVLHLRPQNIVAWCIFFFFFISFAIVHVFSSKHGPHDGCFVSRSEWSLLLLPQRLVSVT